MDETTTMENAATEVQESPLEPTAQQVHPPEVQMPAAEMKFCKHCGQQIPKDAVLCTHCGRQVEELNAGQSGQPNIVINNANTNTNSNVNTIAAGALKREKNKWVALLLCLFLGLFFGLSLS